ncbi:MAG TPA: HEAT repeat domain-containing protein [Candidatus Acidoferrales bacterium]|nr:HEAT repeat domain-containing protein [Candidatus Acidoferrales bacterium]
MSSRLSLLLCVLFLAMAIPLVMRGQQAPAVEQAPLPATPPAAPAPAAPGQEPSKAPQQPPPTAINPKTDLPSVAWALLMQGAASDKLRDRSDAIVALTILEREPKAVSSIATALDDKDESLRFLAATSLGSMKARAAIPRLRSALDDSSAQVSFAAAQALWKMDDRSGREILYEVLDGERKTSPGVIKGKMNKAMADMRDPKALAMLGINEASGTLLGPFSMGVSFIEEYAKKNSAPVQALCAQLLASDNSSGTLDELSEALGDKNWAVRAAAARSLAKLNHTAAIPRLKDMMETDKEQPARFAAAAAIIRLNERARKSALAVPPAGKPKSN